MSQPEKGPITDVFSPVVKSLVSIRDTHLGSISKRAEATLDNILGGHLLVKQAPEFSSWVTNFRLDTEYLNVNNAPTGVIEVDLARGMSADRLDDDLVRTLILATNYLDGDYFRRLTPLYVTAMLGQRVWLLRKGSPSRFHTGITPRIKEFALDSLLGPVMRLSDFDYEHDWPKAITSFEESLYEENYEGAEELMDRLEDIRNDPSTFLSARQRYWDYCREGDFAHSPDFTAWFDAKKKETVEQRGKSAALEALKLMVEQ